ncbi:DctP family TRAP transporter solute-binding subunit [Brevibacterium album]|uniref:DctP family TRAP transporter solute-binding subunit n=1 Tax=Brevibacterium album TaxID=417948 RepID=UPI00048DFDE2|nr:DctP family TRAP transporter solute-binding subunit [Brevibacterium album]
MKNKALLVTGAMAATALVASGCSGAGGGEGGGSYTWDFTITTSDSSTWYEGAERFGELLEEKSDGRMTLNIVANEQLSGGDPAAGVEMLADGGKAFSYNSPIIYSGIDPRFGAITAPFLYENIEEADAVLAGTGAEAYDQLTEEMGIEFLGFGESGFRQLTTADREVTAPEDLDGLKFRVAGSALFLDIYREMGADPVSMNWAEVFTSLQNGTIDGQENPIDIIHSSSLSEVQSHLTLWNYVYDPLILGMNKGMFDELSEEDQQIVTEAAAEANEFQVQANRDKADEQLAELQETMQVVELNPEQREVFRSAMEPVYEKYEAEWTPEIFEKVQPQG